jgi:hypothetical protein
VARGSASQGAAATNATASGVRKSRKCKQYCHQPGVSPPMTRTGGGDVVCKCGQTVRWCQQCNAWCRCTSLRAWREAHGDGSRCWVERKLRNENEEVSVESVVAKARDYVERACLLTTINPRDIQDIASEVDEWNYNNLSLHAPCAGPFLVAGEDEVRTKSDAVLDFAAKAVQKLLAREERKDGSTAKDAGSLPFTLDHRADYLPDSTVVPDEEAAKDALWRLMLDALQVSPELQQEAATWVESFATKIAGHRHCRPALSLHPPGTVTEVHQHLMPVLHLLLKGVKWWFLWPPHSFGDELSSVTHRRESASGPCSLETHEVATLVRLAKKQGFRVRQEAGTMMYLPAGWYHFVVSVGAEILPAATASAAAAPAKTGLQLADAYCVSLVGWLGVANLRAGSYLLALDDHVHEDQTPPDDTEMTFYPLRPWAPPDNAAGARNPRQRAPATRKPMKRRISKIEARRRHNAKIMSMYLEVFGITSVS